MFPVVALSSPLLPWILIGNSSGNRFPVLASSDINYSSTFCPNPGKGYFWTVEKDDESGLYHEIAKQSRWFINLYNRLALKMGANQRAACGITGSQNKASGSRSKALNQT
jgi:hypothetical protein